MKKSLILILCLSLPWLLPAQEASRSERPTIGLVLSGGAAKGFAHIGVLKVLEEVGLQPDYITGTSMGSIMGGMYAIGYRADTMEQIVARQDWNLLLSDRIPLNEVIIEEKPFFKNELIELPLENWTLKPPSGAIYGQQIEELLSQMALPAYHINHFDSLPIPFRCLGADVINGRPVEISEGYLPDALRTSMAIPTVFTAVRRDSMVLVDGGLIRNFPVEEVKNMGADVVIAVYTGSAAPEYESMSSFSEILMQAAFLMSVRDQERQMPLVDLYIAPDLEGFSAADFQAYRALIDAGERAARQQIDALQRLADSLNAFGPSPELKKLARPDSIFIHTVEVEGNEVLRQNEIMGYLEDLVGTPVHPIQLKEAIESLYGTDLFNKVSYRLLRQAGMNVLRIRCEEKALNTLASSLVYDSYHNAGVLLAATTRNDLMPRSRTMLIARISNNFSAELSLLKYLDKDRDSGLFAQIGLHRNEVPIYELGSVISQYRILEFPMDLRWQQRWGKNTLLKLGLRNNILWSDPISGAATQLFEEVRYRSSSGYLGLEHHSLNRNVFPTRGARLVAEAHAIFSDRFKYRALSDPGELPENLQGSGGYQRLNFQLESYIELSARQSLKLGSYLATVVNAENNFSDFFLLGSPRASTGRSIPFYGLDANELPVRSAFGAHLGYQSFLSPNWMLSLDANAAYLAYPETLEGSEARNFFLGGIGVTMGVRTFLGPLSFTLAYPIDPDGIVSRRFRSYLTFGYRF